MSDIYKIETGVNNPILREIAVDVKEIDEDLLAFSENLISYMYDNDGVGLAAPQLGKGIRMIATTQWNKEKFIGETVMINPVILKTSEEMVIGEEACLSLPNENGNVKRYQSIHVEYIDTKGNKQKKKYKGFNAVIVQHEIDHLDGVLFTDKCIEKKQ